MSDEPKRVKPIKLDIEATAKLLKLWKDNQELIEELLGLDEC